MRHNVNVRFGGARRRLNEAHISVRIFGKRSNDFE